MIMYTLYIKLNPELDESIINLYKKVENTGENSGLDLYCPHNINVTKTSMIDHMLSCCMINNDTREMSGYYLYPRSSLSKFPLMMANHVGIIDLGYRGSIMAKVRYIPFADEENIGKYKITKEQRLFQICAPNLMPFKVKFVDTLPSSERGEDGFGSSGL